MELADKVENVISRDRLACEGDRIVVAVSGGPDSMALLHVLFLLAPKFRFELMACHINHGFRPEESEREAEVVAAFAGRLGIPCEIGRFDLPAYIAETGLNAQVAAREKRYAYLHETAERYGANKIALAHHADDQAETVMMRVLRGTGPSGLSGMAVRRTEKKVELIRPFLRIYKSEIERHCDVSGIPVCRDSSNVSRKYFRNVVRLDVLPYLQTYNEKLPESLNRLAEMMRAEDDWMEAETKARFDELVALERKEGRVECSLVANRFAALPVALQRRLIKLILNYVFSENDLADYERIETIREAIVREGGRSLTLDLHERLKLVREYDTVSFVRQRLSDPVRYAYEITGPATVISVPEAGMELACELVGTAAIGLTPARRRTGRSEAFFDGDQVLFPLTVRGRQPGDRMEPLGLKGTKKVKDMFIDEKIPPSARDQFPLVLDAAGRVLWIPGLRRSAHAVVADTTTRVLVMNVRHVER
ncbi:tRNA lysidine(34) synthetase TilS [Paenibacillus ginsengarvi]|uniref:tRNA(Ile)-lysidine synthase n=1 Tax=Paenibacillus ginsengarvi TaxID=400777 RepID=A0A3B0AZP6_9BACL|nr:tRNA lysidine(34) synthetase TilS [Paenibacillus ginsengarvi]RKN65759.1 tRNA lysidine(34) synthetase TilS [Paenibacillus ginsengarvi]